MHKAYLHHSIVFFIKSIQLFDVLRKVLKLLPCGMEHGAVFNAHSGLSYIGRGKRRQDKDWGCLARDGKAYLKGNSVVVKI